MTRTTKSKKKSSSKKTNQNSGHPNDSTNSMPSWVDRVSFRSISGCPETINLDDNEKNTDNNARSSATVVSCSIISWNILADGYCNRNSHHGLPRQYQDVVFDRQRRGSLIRKILCSGTQNSLNGGTKSSTALNLLPDIWALQEVDMDEILSKHLHSQGYEGIETPRMKIGCGAGGKVDSCGIYYHKDRWSMLEHELIRLDDLASMPASSEIDNNSDTITTCSTISSINNNLQGLQRSFLRRNVGLLVRLQSKAFPKVTVVVAVTHLFWNPAYEYVKLCQVHYIMIRARKFVKMGDEPFILCGDLNSLPGSSVHTYLSKGVVNARLVAPWYREGAAEATLHTEQMNGLSKDLSALGVSRTNGEMPEPSPIPSYITKPQQQQIRYLLDYNLNRLCRWFRILGLNVGLETEEEERLRTKEGKIVLFDRCKEEHRVLVTTSNNLLLRTNCPAGTYLINPRSLSSNWEIVLVHILLTHAVQLDPAKFLTRCVVCNGDILTVDDPELKRRIFEDHQAPVEGNDDLDVYQCEGCKQGYWWCDRPTSSATRVKVQATRLYQMCLQAQVSVVPSEPHMFEHVNVEEERKKGWDWNMKGSELLKLKLEVAEWLKDSQLTCPFPRLQSVYKDNKSESGESIPFTNVTNDFEGLLDYIFFDTRSITATKQLYVPATHDELNSQHIPRGWLLPSNVWPSDHLAIGANLVISAEGNP